MPSWVPSGLSLRWSWWPMCVSSAVPCVRTFFLVSGAMSWSSMALRGGAGHHSFPCRSSVLPPGEAAVLSPFLRAKSGEVPDPPPPAVGFPRAQKSFQVPRNTVPTNLLSCSSS